MVFDYSKLLGRITEVFGTRNKFAEKLKIHPSYLCRKLSGLVGITSEEIILWSNLLGIDKSEIGDYFYTLKEGDANEEIV